MPWFQATLMCVAACGTPMAIQCSSNAVDSTPVAQQAVYDRGPLNYLLFMPTSTTAQVNGRWPMILSLHGIGERGNDLQTLKRDGLPKILDGFNSFEFIVISPQCPATTEWYYDRTDTLVSKLLDVVVARYPIDTNRVYVTGYSMGGIGTWDLAIRNPTRFASIAPIAARREPGWNPCPMRDVPVWAFHGDQDNVVPLSRGQDVVDALRACGGSAQFTVYAGVGHDSWTKTYGNPEIYRWLLTHTKRP